MACFLIEGYRFQSVNILKWYKYPWVVMADITKNILKLMMWIEKCYQLGLE